MLVELLLPALVVALVALAWREIRRPGCSPLTLWVAGWLSAGAGTLFVLTRAAFPSLYPLSFPLGSLFPALLLGGALMLSGRPLPRWLLPGAVAFGAFRAALAATAGDASAYLASLALEPFVVLAAGWIVSRATPRDGATASERWLAPSFAALALFGAVHVGLLLRDAQVPAGLYALWVVAVPLLVGVQIQAEAARARHTLESTLDALETRVEERTADLRALNAALRESEERHRVVSQLGSDVIFGFRIGPGLELRDGWINDAFSRITGFKLDDVQGSGWRALIHPDDRASHGAQLDAVIAGRRQTIESRMLTRDGRVLTFHSRVQIQADPEPGFVRLLGAGRDVTAERQALHEQRRLEQHLRETQRLESIALLAGGIAHDFNNLLAVVLGNTRIALADLADDSPLRPRLARIRSAAEHGARLTEQMLIYAGRSSVSLKPIDLSHLVEEMADMLRASVTEQCELTFSLGPHALVEGDDTQLRQVLVNLVGNASEALPDGRGTVTVRTGRATLEAGDLAGDTTSAVGAPGAYAFLEVTDDGLGMDEATQARIFEPFFSTKRAGRGLGLAAALGIVRAHRGVVKVRSAPGCGSTIGVWLPSLPGILAEAGPAPPPVPVDSGGTAILVVDDDTLVLEVAQLFLERAGFEVRTALGGHAGIATFRACANEIALVLLDLAMPDADGEEVLREIRRLRPGVPVIIASGYSATSSQARLGALGSMDFVRKPYEPEDLVARVREALGRRG